MLQTVMTSDECKLLTLLIINSAAVRTTQIHDTTSKTISLHLDPGVTS